MFRVFKNNKYLANICSILILLSIVVFFCFFKTSISSYREGLEVNKVGTAKGGWGGSCTCPDGQVYQVSDNNTYGKELACYGGVTGKVNRFSGPWSGKSVTCAPKVEEPALKDYVEHSENTKLPEQEPTTKFGDPPEAPGCYVLLPDGCPNYPNEVRGWTAKKNTWQLDQPWVLPLSGKNKQICDERANQYNGWCKIKDAQTFFRA